MIFRTAGESHGKGILGFFDRMPANLRLNEAEINRALSLRQSGYGRGGRQAIEKDEIEVLSGLRNSFTLGSPLSFIIRNKDNGNWSDIMDAWNADTEKRTLTAVRPGHADLAGVLKYRQTDARNILERASARETAAKVAGGSIAEQFLSALGVEVRGYVRGICGICDDKEYSFGELDKALNNELFMMDKMLEESAKLKIDELKESGDTAGGIIEIRVNGLKSGFGSCFNASDRLDAILSFAIMGVQAIKGVEFGKGFNLANMKGSEAHDEIFFDGKKYYRNTNNAGGVEGGMSNGEELVIRAAMKPIPTLMKGLKTVDIATGGAASAASERSDVTAVPACMIVLKSVTALAIMEEILKRLGGDSMEEILKRWNGLI